MTVWVYCQQLQTTIIIITYRAGNFHEVQNFAFFEGRAVNAKIKMGINSHTLVFHMQIKLLVALEPNSENCLG